MSSPQPLTKSKSAAANDDMAVNKPGPAIKKPAKAPIWAQSVPTPAASPVVMREEKKETEKSAESDKETEESGDVAFGSYKSIWYLIEPLIMNFPSRWQTFIKKAKEDLSDEDQEMYHKLLGSLQNLMYAGIYTGLSSYRPDWSKSLKIAENLSGISDTYLNLVSFAVMRDIEKYFSDDVDDVIKQNIGWLILYGALIQGGLVGLDAGLKKDLDFTSLISVATSKWTDAPSAFGRPFQLKNVPDPRWGSYSFGSSPTGFGSSLSGYGDPEKPYAFNLKLGLNIASIADLYPEDEEEKKKYQGFELYPYFSLKHEWAKGDIAPDMKNTWLVGAFIGGAGVYSLIEGGQQTRPDDTVAETYLRNAFTLRGWGPLSFLALSQEYSFRPEDQNVRARLNAATEIKLVDEDTWESTIGASIGGLLPGEGFPGAIDAAGKFSIFHKYTRGEGESAETFKTGISAESTWRPEDPFSEVSPQLFSIGGKLSILDMVIFSFEHHQLEEGLGMPETQLDPEMPTQDTRFMLMFGPGIWKWY